MKHEILFLGSQSQSRQALLQEAGIPFRTIPHYSSEQETDFRGDLEAYVVDIARHKMESLLLPSTAEVGLSKIIVLTADSLVQDPQTKLLLGKPEDEADAARMLALARIREMLIMTGCCLREYFWENGAWCMKREQVWATPTAIEFIVPEDELAYYFAHVPGALFSAGAGILEEFGANYLKSVRGSFSGGRGLPLFELRCALRTFDFEFK
jgi:septum formation protein